MDIFLDFYSGVARQGPGDEASTLQALDMLGKLPSSLNILDIGCGAGAQSLVLAENIEGKVVALDCNECFLQELRKKLAESGLNHKILPMLGSMFDLSFPEESFDIIWSEGAIYLAGFEKGIQDWRRFLKKGGFLVASEMSWLRKDIPEELFKYWKEQYSEVDFISAKIGQIEKHGYAPFGYFVLPESAWLENFYAPLESKKQAFLDKHKNSTEALQVVEEFEKEFALYKEFNKYYGYVFYIARKV